VGRYQPPCEIERRFNARREIEVGRLGSVGDWALRDFEPRFGSEAFPSTEGGFVLLRSAQKYGCTRHATAPMVCIGSLQRKHQRRPVEPRAEGTSSAVLCLMPPTPNDPSEKRIASHSMKAGTFRKGRAIGRLRKCLQTIGT
jgi:hypothetical protein